LDLLPLASKRLAGCEAIGATIRVGCVALVFYRMPWSPGVLLFYALATGVYFAERRARIQRGRRHEYGWFHHFEHLAIVALLFAANADRLDARQVWIRLALTPVVLFSALTLLGVAINRSLRAGD